MAGDLEHRGVDAGGGDIGRDLSLGGTVGELLRDEEDTRAVVGDEQVEGYVPSLQALAARAHQLGEALEAVAKLEAQAAHWVVYHLAHRAAVAVALLVHVAGQATGGRALDGERLHEIVGLEVQVVDGGVRAQRVVSHAEVRVARLGCHVQGGQQELGGDALGEAVGDARAQEHVAVLDGADVDENHGGVCGNRARNVELRRAQRALTLLEAEQNLLLVCLGEVELAAVEVLAHGVHGELGGALLGGAPLVELRHKAKGAGHHFGLARGDVIAEEPRRELVLPRREQDAVERGNVLDVSAGGPGRVVAVPVGGPAVAGVGIDVRDTKVVEVAKGAHTL
mmetsp:Transcript_2766/g.4428  ORF Transcript_2766/g.4428 Transcript_2766/m.4428 type:complete len:338 (+) Transcript_2766:973-1986(+)